MLFSVLLCACTPEQGAVSVDGTDVGKVDGSGSGNGDGSGSGKEEGTPGKEDEPPAVLPLSLAVSADINLGFSPENGDRAGMTVLGGREAFLPEGAVMDDVPLVYDGSRWTLAGELTFVDDGPAADFCCRCPLAEGTTEDGTFTVAVQTDQSGAEGFRKSFAFYGKSAGVRLSKAPVRVEMKNLMSRLKLSLKAGTGWTSEDIASASVRFCGLCTSAVVRIEDGETVSTGDVAEILPMDGGDGTWSAIVVPQSVSSDVPLAEISVGGDEYVLKTSVVLGRGKRHTCTLTLNRTEGSFGVGVSDWMTDGEDYGGDTI